MAGSDDYVSSYESINVTGTSRHAAYLRLALCEQHLHARLDSGGVFDLITDDRFLDILEQQLPAHRERLYPHSRVSIVNGEKVPKFDVDRGVAIST